MILVITAITAGILLEIQKLEFLKFLEFLNFFTDYGVAVTAIATTLLAGITLIYAWLTSKLSYETTLMREAQTEPHISAIIQSEERNMNLIDLVIQNIGFGPAYNVKFLITPDFENRFCKLSDIGFIKNGLDYFAPNQKFQFFIANMLEEDLKNPKEFKIEITYEYKIHGKSEKKTGEYTIDFSQFRGMTTLINDLPIEKIAKNIELIQVDINRISTGKTELKIINYTKEEIEAERKQKDEQIREKQLESSRSSVKQ